MVNIGNNGVDSNVELVFDVEFGGVFLGLKIVVMVEVVGRFLVVECFVVILDWGEESCYGIGG